MKFITDSYHIRKRNDFDRQQNYSDKIVLNFFCAKDNIVNSFLIKEILRDMSYWFYHDVSFFFVFGAGMFSLVG